MRVCHVINRLSSGGAQSVVQDIVRGASDIEYTICCLEASLEYELADTDIRVLNFDEQFKFDPRMLSRLFRFLQKEQFDVLHLHLPYSQVVGRVLSRVTGVDHVVSTFHSQPDNYHPVTRTLERITRPIDTVSVAVSKGVQRAHGGEASCYDGEVSDGWCTIYNGIDVERFRSNVTNADENPLRRRYDLGDAPVFLNASRYIPAKAQKDAIRAMSHVIDEYPNAMLFIIGRGPLQDELRDEVVKLGLEDNVKIPGFASGEELYAYYSVSDGFVLPSISEGFGIVLIEAMAAGIPVVATDIPGVNEVVVDGETGRIVPAKDPEQLATGMEDIVEPTNRETYAASAFRRVKAQFDIENMSASYVDLYRRVSQS